MKNNVTTKYLQGILNRAIIMIIEHCRLGSVRSFISMFNIISVPDCKIIKFNKIQIFKNHVSFGYWTASDRSDQSDSQSSSSNTSAITISLALSNRRCRCCLSSNRKCLKTCCLRLSLRLLVCEQYGQRKRSRCARKVHSNFWWRSSPFLLAYVRKQ